MAEELGTDIAELVLKSRRDFFRTSAKVAVTAPAVALLLNASIKQAHAQVADYTAETGADLIVTGDDGGADDQLVIVNAGNSPL